jgi:tetratricopeptide (TPR) repeat protein
MKYSENPRYREFMERKARGDLEGARQSLIACMNELEEAERIQRSDLLQRIGNLCFEQGDAATALDYYDRSESVDPGSLLAPYYYAKFLAEKLKQHERAIAKCDDIIARATASPFQESADDFGSLDYIRMAEELKQKCQDARSGGQ